MPAAGKSRGDLPVAQLKMVSPQGELNEVAGNFKPDCLATALRLYLKNVLR
jgi:hypothetical protein